MVISVFVCLNVSPDNGKYEQLSIMQWQLIKKASKIGKFFV